MTRFCLAVLVAACAPPISAVRQLGAQMLKCPAQHLALERTGNYEFRATGCGYSIDLRCATPTGDGPCGAAPIAQAPAPVYSYTTMGSQSRVMQAVVSEPIIARAPPPLLQPYRSTVVQAPPIYMPGQYNPNTGTIQHDYAHQYTRPYTPPPPVYTPPLYTHH